MKSLQDIHSLKRAGVYASPRQPSQALPIVYGDLDSQTAQGGVWRAVCVDTQAHVYALAGTPILSQEAGNRVRLFDCQGQEILAFGFDPANDFQGLGLIATVTMAQDMRSREPLSAAYQGRAGTGGLLSDPVEILQDFLLNLAGLEPTQLDGASWARAKRRSRELGYQAAGVINSDQALGSTLSQVLGCFLGSWWLDSAGRLRLVLEGGRACLEGEVAHAFAPLDTLDAQAAVDIKNTCNRLACQYAYNWQEDEYQVYDDSQESKDLLSRSLYGDQPRSLRLPWLRLAQVARRVQETAVKRFASGARLNTLDAPSLPALHLEKGDHAWFSSYWLRDAAGRPMRDQLVRVLSLANSLDSGTTSFTLEDTGFYRTLAGLAGGEPVGD